jgi:hypothetical protein
VAISSSFGLSRSFSPTWPPAPEGRPVQLRLLDELRITVGGQEIGGGLRKAREMLRTATGLAAPMWIINTGGRYQLDASLIGTDLQAFASALERAGSRAGKSGWPRPAQRSRSTTAK